MVIRSALFNALFWLWVLSLVVVLPIAYIYRPFSHNVSRAWAHVSLWLLRVLCNITHEIRGKEHIPAGTVIVASKHQSAWDTIIFWLLFNRPSFVLKRELIFFPVFGSYLVLLQNIYINRKAGASAIKQILRQAQDRVKEGRSIIIFPEGTRTMVGAASVYHPGVAALYQNLELPVVPVAVNSGLYWSKNAFVKQPGKIIMEFLPPIQPGMKNREFLGALQEQVETATNRLVAEGRNAITS